MGQVQRINGADNSTGNPVMAKHQFEAGAHRIDPRAQAHMPAGQRLFNQNGLAVGRGVIDHRPLGLFIEVVGDHRAITGFQGLEPSFNGFARQAETANLALALKLGQGFVDFAAVENGKVIPTEAVCGICGSKSTAIYETGKAPAGSKVETLNGVTGYVVVPNGTATTPSTDKNTSPKTFDAGIAMYVGMALTSVAGSAVVIGKKKEF